MNQPDRLDAASLTEAEVAGFLREHPGFLADHPALYLSLHPPRRVHGDGMADHMAAMLAAERAHGADMAARADGMLAAGRATAGFSARTQEAVLALIAATDVADCIVAELPGLLAVDAVRLHREGLSLRAGDVRRLLDGRAGVFRTAPTDAGLMHGEAAALARVDALVRVPLPGAPTLLALAARDASALDPAQGMGALTFLGRAVAAALTR